MWYLLYISTVMTAWADIGLMADGPFKSETACYAHAEKSWKESSGWILDSRGSSKKYKLNFYSSKYKVFYVDNEKANVGTYYSCVEPRNAETKK